MRLKGQFWSGWYTALLLTAGVVFIIIELPQGYSSDLSIIGQGKDAIVIVHDSKSFPSVEFLSRMNVIRDKHKQQAVFSVADIKDKAGAEFAQKHSAKPLSLLLFTADGTPLGSISGNRSSDVILDAIEGKFQWQHN